VPRVDKIVGPGNVYVAEAKRQVFGQVGIDMVAGPSEILVITHGRTPADWLAMDLFSQSEHDEAAQALLLSPQSSYLDQVELSMKSLLPAVPRREIIAASVDGPAALFKTTDPDGEARQAARGPGRSRGADGPRLFRTDEIQMSPEKLVPPEILALSAYQVPEAQGMVKLDAMENPYPLPPALRRELAEALSRVDLNRYPEPTGRRVRELLARRMNLPAGMELLLGNGSDDLLQIITLAVARPGTTMMYPAPSIVMYGMNAALCGMKAVAAPLREDFSFDADAFLARMKSERPALVFI